MSASGSSKAVASSADASEARKVPFLQRLDRRAVWLATSLVTFAGLTVVAFTQPLRPDPLAPVQIGSLDWFHYPIERNAHLRVPVVSSRLFNVCTVPGSDHVWAVGEHGLIIHSLNGGEDWEQHVLTLPEPVEPAGGCQADADCNDDDLCTGDETCDVETGFCVAGTPVDCDDGDVCTIDSCNQGICANDEIICEDGERCNPATGLCEPTFDEFENLPQKGGKDGPIGAQNDIPRRDQEQMSLPEQKTPDQDSKRGSRPNNKRQSSTPPENKKSRDSHEDESSLNIRSSFNPKRGDSIAGDTRVTLAQSSAPPTNKQTASNGPDGLDQANSPARETTANINLVGVFFLDTMRGWAVGMEGTVVGTEDMGVTWNTLGVIEEVDTEPFRGLVRIHFSSANLGWLFDKESKTIFRTSNGGAAWEKWRGPENVALNSVHFTSLLTGFAVGVDGVILRTIDGGATWTPVNSPVTDELFDITFVGEQVGWIVGADATILRTTDGGMTWSKHAPNVTGDGFGDENHGFITTAADYPWFSSYGLSSTWRMTQDIASIRMLFVSAGRKGAWSINFAGTLASRHEQGSPWETATRPGVVSLAAVDSAFAYGVSPNGNLSVTTDGGQSWTTPSGLKGFAHLWTTFADRRHGWSVSFNSSPGLPELQITSDGGRSWKSVSIEDVVLEAQAVDSSRLIGFSNGEVSISQNGGRTWSHWKSPDENDGVRFYVLNSTNVWVCDDSGTLFHSQDGATTWSAISAPNALEDHIRYPRPPDPSSFLAWGGVHWRGSKLFFADAETGWFTSRKNKLLRTTDGGKTWPVINESFDRVDHLIFADTTTGWAYRNNTTFKTIDGGKTWSAVTSKYENSYIPVKFFDGGKLGYAYGPGGTFLKTTDRGATWFDPQLPPKRWPAPWYYLALLAPLGMLFQTLRPPKPIEVAAASVKNDFSSDRPLEKGDPDPLQFGRISRGLSRFLRNEKTEPPLTIAITGEWGTGKSSLMNLVNADLREEGIRSVWFNAWHHQKEEHLLAALLQNIRLYGIPSVFTYVGARYRMRLFSRRLRRRWLISMLMFFFLGGSLVVFASPGGQADPGSFWGWILEFLSENAPERLPSNYSWGALLGLLGMIPPLGAALKALKSFGINPANLMTTAVRSDKSSKLEAQAGFRTQFAHEFREVTKALNPYTMVIFIDDLDRCKPDNVLEVLEAVNFLASSGDCFIIMGLARERVMRCVGLGFKDVAEELLGDENLLPGESAEKAARRRRTLFAQQYMEKLINIEVPIPPPSDEQSKELVTPTREQDGHLAARRRRGRGFSLIRGAAAAGVCMLAGVLFARSLGVGVTRNDTTTQVHRPVASASSGGLSSSAGRTQPDAGRTPARSAAPDDGGKIDPIFRSAWETTRGVTSAGFALVVLLFLGFVGLSIKRDVVVKDSDKFTKAIRVWRPVMIAKRHTPRAIKRFLNRVRYYAMLQRPEEDRVSKLSAVWSALKFGNGRLDGDAGKKHVADGVLVALSALRLIDSASITDDEQWKEFKNSPKNALDKFASTTDEERQVILKALEDHGGDKTLGTVLNDESRRILLKLWDGVHVG